MNEERTEYSIVGTVTIGTDEYRDLIESVKESEATADRKNRDWCDQYNRANRLEKELKELEEKFKNYDKFIHSDGMLEKYKLFIISLDTED